MNFKRFVALAAASAVLGLGLVGCASDEAASPTTEAKAGDSSTSTTTTAAPKKLTILVSNDDGYNAPGIDALVQALVGLPDTEVIVSAPATQQSGKGSSVTEGELTASDAKTLSGHAAHAVAGTPADSVNWALNGGIDVKPDLVVTGINMGQNLGGIGDRLSGTLGAARAAVAHGIPALATSMGLNAVDGKDVADYPLAAKFVIDWVKEHREDVLAGKLAGATPLLENMNIPSCVSGGEIRGVVETEMSKADKDAIAAQNCQSTVPAPADDISAFNLGFVTISSATPVSAG